MTRRRNTTLRMRNAWLRGVAAIALWAAIAASAVARQVPITILCTTDLHGRLLPSDDYDDNRDVGGLLRCASLMAGIRAGSSNVLHVDCGDLIQGGAESWLGGGRSMVRALEWMKCDAWVLGNHDFDWGVEALGRLHDMASIPMLAANVAPVPGADWRFPKLKPFVIREVDGVRVAIVGVTTPGVPTWLMPEMRAGVLFEDSVTALRRHMPAVKAAKPDIIVLAVHQGLPEFRDDRANEVNAIAAQFPEVDLIFGGHTHKVVEGVRVNDILFVQAGYHGQFVGRADLVYDTVQRRVVSRSSEVIRVGDAWPAQPELQALLQKDLDRAGAYLSKELGQAVEPVASHNRFPGDSGVHRIIASAIREKTGADVVLHGVFEEKGLEAGPITMADVWRLVPYENRIGILSLTPAELREVLEENALWEGSSSFMGAMGVIYDLDSKADEGSRVRNLRWADGSAMHGRKRLKVAVNSYVLASGGGRFPVLSGMGRREESRVQMTDIDTRSAVIDYIRKSRRLSADGSAARREAVVGPARTE